MATTSLLAALGLGEDHSPLYLLGEAGYARLYQGRAADARLHFRALRALLPEAPVGYLGLAEVDLAEGAPAAALSLANEALALSTLDEPSMALALEVCARARLRSGDFRGARAAFTEGSRLCADVPLAKAFATWLAAVDSARVESEP